MIHVWDLVDVFVIEIGGNHVELSMFVFVAPIVDISADVVSIPLQVSSILACLHPEPWRSKVETWRKNC